MKFVICIEKGIKEMYKLENWSIVETDLDPYKPPECKSKKLSGSVYDHPRFLDGKDITTSRIVGAYQELNNIVVETKSGSKYVLGKMSEDYQKWLDENKLIFDPNKLITNN